MIGRNNSRCLTDLAVHLTRIAIRKALLGFSRSPRGGGAAEPSPKGPSKRFGGTEAHRQRDVENRHTWLSNKPHGCDLNLSTTQIVTKCSAIHAEKSR